MHVYDLLMIAILVGATIFGLIKGMAWQIASLGSLVVSYFVALRFREQLAPFFGDQQPWNRFLAMLVVYIACSLVIWLAFRFVSGVIDKIKLKDFDRQLGAILGFAKGVLLCAVVTFFAVTLLPPAKKQAVVASRSGHYIGVLLERTRPLVPPEYCEVIKPYLDKFEERLDTETAPAPGDASATQGEDKLSLPPAWDPPQTANRPAPPSY